MQKIIQFRSIPIFLERMAASLSEINFRGLIEKYHIIFLNREALKNHFNLYVGACFFPIYLFILSITYLLQTLQRAYVISCLLQRRNQFRFPLNWKTNYCVTHCKQCPFH